MKIWQKAEKVVQRLLVAEFKEGFTKKDIPIGSKPRSFDFVSDSGAIIAQVKSCSKRFAELTRPQLDTRFQRDYIFDCLLLSRTEAKRKLFFLAADRQLFDEFTSWAEGLVPGVDVRWVDTSSD